MPRGIPATAIDAGCYHITHRCQERRFLLRYARDRQQVVRRLREMKLRYPVSLLNYVVTSNHIHLLLWASCASSISGAMQFLGGVTARDYNRRVAREGAFWRGRYHATLIENGRHLSRCFFYISLNMVRARVVEHPSEWAACAHEELCGHRQRYRVLDLPKVCSCLECGDLADFRSWYLRTLEWECAHRYDVREPYWSEAAAVGSEAWIQTLYANMPRSWGRVGAIDLTDEVAGAEVAEEDAVYTLEMSARRQEGLLSLIDRTP